MNAQLRLKSTLQLSVVLLCALALKLFYSTASPDELRWILAPTTFFVELISGKSFRFEANAGYMMSDRTFIIAASCAGVNFLITSFLMLSLRKLWKDRSQNINWIFIPCAALIAYLATLVANTIRIWLAMWLLQLSVESRWLSSWLNPTELHRLDGIAVYFGFLLLLIIASEKMRPENALALVRLCLFPLLIYYATMLVIPLANGAFRTGIVANDFWRHSGFVFLTPLLLILLVVGVRFSIAPRAPVGSKLFEKSADL